MKKWSLVCALIALSLVSCLPIIGIVYKHVRTTKRWEALNSHILALKVMKDQSDLIDRMNERLKQQHKNIQPQEFIHASKKIRLLGKEQDRLASLKENSLISQSKEVWSRKQLFLSSNNQAIWSIGQISDDLISLRLENPVEADSDNLEELFYLFDTTNPNAPLAFFIHWEMTKLTTPLNNQVWSINAEAISRWL
ncbi:hypothetical protein SBV42_01910 [Chlamydia crocodili]|uniref:Lipoprotein n=1 Tax=Chlamydia crocodili TaxID=2766982 RepID=A0ABX8CES8_9CHLA|nr:hypothetical protein [Chlamydia crocodili]QVE49513.1 hypothetical protein H9Q19_02290 [Chlamydia crocodili]